jgi:hypothetical protein
MPPSEQAAKGDKAMKRRSEVILTAKGPVVTGREGSRAVAKLALAALLALCGAGAALAQDYPNKPIRLISAHAAGGGADQVSRTISDPLSRLLRQPVIVENRAGASTMIAA